MPNIDFNLQHYIGDRSDVIKSVLSQVKEVLRSTKLSEAQRAMYSAVYNALTYYQSISSVSISGETENPTFLEQTIEQINEDYKYLSQKYNSDNPTSQVITMKARIKSPISAMQKILDKVAEYVHTGRDLSKLNESLRDFIGIRIIIDPPAEIKALGKQAEADYCYQIFDDLMKYHGIERQLTDGATSLKSDFTFIPVATTNNPQKHDEIKNRPSVEGYAFNPEKEGVFIPESRPEYVEQYDGFFKDYIRWPKFKLYQRIHACVKPGFENNEDLSTPLPLYIIPSQANHPAIEYQICTSDQEDFAEHGKAAHTEYKSRAFHRLRIPLLISFDSKLQRLRLNRLDESMEEFFGYSFQDMFDINYQDFLKTFNTQERDAVLAGLKVISFDRQNGEYCLKDTTRPIIVPDEPNLGQIEDFLKLATPEQLKAFYEANGILDNTIQTGVIPVKGSIRQKFDVLILKNGDVPFFKAKIKSRKRGPRLDDTVGPDDH